MDGLENVDSFGFGFLGSSHKILVVIAVDDVPVSCDYPFSSNISIYLFMVLIYDILLREKKNQRIDDIYGGVWLSYLNQFIGQVDLERSQ
jgi:hypothetical protein